MLRSVAVVRASKEGLDDVGAASASSISDLDASCRESNFRARKAFSVAMHVDEKVLEEVLGTLVKLHIVERDWSWVLNGSISLCFDGQYNLRPDS